MTLRIPYGRQYVDEDDIAAVSAVLREWIITGGPRIDEFEAAVALYVGARHAIAVSNGTAALHLAAMAAGLGTGDNVVTCPNTFVASANAACFVGAQPRFADIDATSLCLSAESLEQECARLKRVAAVIPVHFAGTPCDMPAIAAIARRAGALIIEDAAHALGGHYADGGRIGNCAYSDMTVFSFHPVKMITTGEGGMITTNSTALYRRLLRLRSHGINKLDDAFQNHGRAYTDGVANAWYYEMQELGFNYRITDLQAALGISQFRKLEVFLARRRQLAHRYDDAFLGCARIRPQQERWRALSALHLYVVRIDFSAAGISRNSLMRRLRAEGIGTQVHYIPVHFHPYYQRLGFCPGDFPVAERYYEQALSIPLYFGLTDNEQQLVINRVREFVE